MVEGMRVVGYVRVSSSEQADSGLGLEAQRSAIEQECERKGWELVSVFEDAAASGKSLNGRPALQEALGAVESDAAGGLVVSKLDRLSRSLLDFASLMERSKRNGWHLVALDLALDTSTPSGELMANVLMTFSQFERRLIGQRTKDALAVKKSQGIQLGRPRVMAAKTRRRILRERSRGDSFQKIAAGLNDDGVATAHSPDTGEPMVEFVHGKRWYPSTVRHVTLAG